MVVRYPNARWKSLGIQTEPEMTSHDIICIHTMVGYLHSTDYYFRYINGPGYKGTESHFGIGGKWGTDTQRKYDGAVFQWQDLMFQADANLNGGGNVISIETADNAPKRDVDIDVWTPKQVDAIVHLISWLCSKEAHKNCPKNWACYNSGIPAKLITNTKLGNRGLAYHAQGIPPNLVSGGVAWSEIRGKTCPGPRRIKQFKNEIIPRIQSQSTGVIMSKQIVIEALRTNIAKNRNGKTPDEKTLSVVDFIEMADDKIDELRRIVKILSENQQQLMDEIKKLRGDLCVYNNAQEENGR